MKMKEEMYCGERGRRYFNYYCSLLLPFGKKPVLNNMDINIHIYDIREESSKNAHGK